jgi:hypothetical protein
MSGFGGEGRIEWVAGQRQNRFVDRGLGIGELVGWLALPWGHRRCGISRREGHDWRSGYLLDGVLFGHLPILQDGILNTPCVRLPWGRTLGRKNAR